MLLDSHLSAQGSCPDAICYFIGFDALVTPGSRTACCQKGLVSLD
jgi:hypothetical protein